MLYREGKKMDKWEYTSFKVRTSGFGGGILDIEKGSYLGLGISLGLVFGVALKT